MDFNGAKQLALKAFLELENSGQIYRGDNLDILSALSSQKQPFPDRHRTVTIDSLKVDFVAPKRSNAKKTTSTGGELA